MNTNCIFHSTKIECQLYDKCVTPCKDFYDTNEFPPTNNMPSKYQLLCQKFGEINISKQFPDLYTINVPIGTDWRLAYDYCQQFVVHGITNLNGVVKIYVEV